MKLYSCLSLVASLILAAAHAAEPAAAPAAASVERSDAEAQFILGRAYLRGEGEVSQNDSEALAHFRKAAELGHVKAMNNLGMMYAEGRGIAANPAEALKWLRQAAGQGAPLAQFNLAEMLKNGTGIPKDLPEAIAWYRKAAEQNVADAQLRLGQLYFLGTEGLEKDYPEAAKWLSQAAPTSPWAQNALGVLFEDGLGVQKDERRAVELFQKAAELGEASAQCNLGRLYSLGHGVGRNVALAYQWLTLSAEQADPAGQNLLADFAPGLSADELAEGKRLLAEYRAKSRKQNGTNP